MAFDDSDGIAPADEQFEPAPDAVKILIAGGFGAGKTTLVGALTEIRALRTEEYLSAPGAQVDALTGVADKRVTTVAMDFGRITLSDNLVIYLFGTPGQERFWFMWDDLSRGALGAVVLADTRRLTDCFAAVDYFERRKRPFIVALNQFDGAESHSADDVRLALDLETPVPIVACDARARESCRAALVTLVDHAIDQVS